MIPIRNLEWLRKLTLKEIPDFGARFMEIFRDVQKGVGTIEQQTNASATGNPQSPPPIQTFKVVPHENGFEYAISHEGDFYRGIHYLIHHADNSSHFGYHTVDVGESRNGILPLGKVTRYFQVTCKYPWSNSTAPVVLSGPVTGGVPRGTFLDSQGFGTCKPGQPPQFQPPFRSVNGAPPLR